MDTKAVNVIGAVRCIECKKLVDSLTLLEHYWDHHPKVASQVYDQSRTTAAKAESLREAADEGMVGYKDYTCMLSKRDWHRGI